MARAAAPGHLGPAGTTADLVYGQSSMVSGGHSLSATKLFNPTAVADQYNSRVLRFPAAPAAVMEPVSSPAAAGPATAEPSAPAHVAVSWTSLDAGTSNLLFGVACPTASLCFATGAGGSAVVSTNGGATWTTSSTGIDNQLDGTACTSWGVCMAAGYGGTILISMDGTSWTDRFIGTGARWLGITCTINNLCLAVGEYGDIAATSDGGDTWTIRSSGRSSGLVGIACSTSEACVAVGDGGAVVTTADGGATWLSRASGTHSDLYGINCLASGECVAVGAGGTILTSADAGATWSVGSSGVSAWLHGISCQESVCLAVGAAGTTVASTDNGATWTSLPAPSSSDLYGITCAAYDVCFAVGDGGTLLAGNVSGVPLPTPTPVTTACTVTSAEDSDGPGTLRTAIPQCPVITLDLTPTTTLTLTSPLEIGTSSGNNTGSVEIDVPYTTTATIAGSQATPLSRVFTVDAGASLTLRGDAGHPIGVATNLTISNGEADSGGAMYNQGTLSVDEAVLAGNEAGFSGGGAIYNQGSLSLDHVVLSNNRAGSGGALYNAGNGNGLDVGTVATVTMTDTTLSDNVATKGGGGAICNDGNQGAASVIALGTTMLSGNHTTPYSVGGAIYNSGDEGFASITLSGAPVIEGNYSGRGGGAIYNGDGGGTATIALSGATLEGNDGEDGGAIYNDGSGGTATVTIVASALRRNVATTRDRGAIYNDADSGTALLSVSATTLSGNNAPHGNGGAMVNDGQLGLSQTTLDGVVIGGAAEGDGNFAMVEGGGIDNVADAGTADLVLNRSSVIENQEAMGSIGGGIASRAENLLCSLADSLANVTITNSTFSGNSASLGQAIANYVNSISCLDAVGEPAVAAAMTIANSTFSGNGADAIDDSGGDYARLAIHSCILADSVDAECGGDTKPIDDGYTVALTSTSGTNSCGLDASTDIFTADPGFAAGQPDHGQPADNGGIGLQHPDTIALAGNSVARRMGDCGPYAGRFGYTYSPIDTDQRGYARRNGSSCDAGAYEYGALAPDAHRATSAAAKLPVSMRRASARTIGCGCGDHSMGSTRARTTGAKAGSRRR